MSLCHCGRQSNKARHSWWLCFLGVSGVSYHWIYPRSFVSTVHSKGIGGKVHLFSEELFVGVYTHGSFIKFVYLSCLEYV